MRRIASIIAFLTAFPVAGIAGIHIYWAFGGRIGYKAAVPMLHGEPITALGPLYYATMILLPLLGAYVLLCLAGVFKRYLEEWFYSIAVWTMGALFALRAVGDFRTVGIFKDVGHTSFAYFDNTYVVPLSIFLAAACLLTAAIDLYLKSKEK